MCRALIEALFWAQVVDELAWEFQDSENLFISDRLHELTLNVVNWNQSWIEYRDEWEVSVKFNNLHNNYLMQHERSTIIINNFSSCFRLNSSKVGTLFDA